MILLFLPLLIMGLAYWLIAARLWKGLQHITNATRLKSLGANVSHSPTQELPPSGQQSSIGNVTTCYYNCYISSILSPANYIVLVIQGLGTLQADTIPKTATSQLHSCYLLFVVVFSETIRFQRSIPIILHL